MSRIALVAALGGVVVTLAWLAMRDDGPARAFREGRLLRDVPRTRDAGGSPATPAPAPARAIPGTVVDAADRPLPGATVHAHGLDDDNAIVRWDVRGSPVDAAGGFALARPPGTYLVFARAGGLRSPQRRVVVPHDGPPLVLRVAPGPATLRVELAPRTGPVDAAGFRLVGAAVGDKGAPDADGGWSLDGLHVGDRVRFTVRAPREHVVWPQRGRDEPALRSNDSALHVVRIDGPRVRHRAEVDAHAFVAGELIGPDGAPAVGRVQLVSGDRFWQTSGQVGEFSLRALPGLPLSLYVTPGIGSDLGLARPLALPPLDGGGTRRLSLRLVRLRGAVSLRVVDPDGAPVMSLRVDAVVRPGPHRMRRSAPTGEDGRVRIDALPPEAGHLTVDPPPHAPWAPPLPIPFELVTRDHADLGTLRFSPGGAIAGHVPGADGAQVRAFPLDADGKAVAGRARFAEVGPDGTVLLERLAPARWRVRVGTGPPVEVAVVDGGTARVTLPSPR